jgi:STE24 endopeptidase
MNEDKSTRYHRLKRQISLLGFAWALLLLSGLALTGGSLALRRAAEVSALRLMGDRWLDGTTVLIYVALLTLLNEMVSLPLGLYGGHLVERRYGLSNETLGRWFVDEAKSFGVGLLLSCGGATLVYALMRGAPDRWWLTAGALFAVLIVGLTNLAPVLVLPLFYTIKPLTRDVLRARLLALAERAGAKVLGAYEWGLSQKTKKANAALAGIGRTRRILVSDTMLSDYSDEEIEVVLAHELAHHVHGDIWKGLVFESGLVLAGFYLASRALVVASPWLGLRDVADPAGLPLLLLSAGGLSLVMMPVANAMSRSHERSADRFALQLTKNPGAFISAMRRLGAQNLAEEHPSKLVQWLFYSHPPIRERIASAEAFRSHPPSR